MTHDHPTEAAKDRPGFDPRRSAEIRALLIRTVVATPRPRQARLSRTAFALAATVALLFAGGVGAGTVAAYDRLTDPLVAQGTRDPERAEGQAGEFQGMSAQNQDVTASASADSDFEPRLAADLTAVLELDGETGYAYRGDIQAAQLVLSGTSADAAESSGSDGRVPIYRADGVTVLGFLDPAGLLPD